MARLGIIGGSGVYHLPELADAESREVDTPFGAPSGAARIGQIGEVEVVFIPRHGYHHSLSPTSVPYRANVYALKALGVTHLLSISAVGSLAESLPPRTAVVPDQIIDRTVARDRTFFDVGIVAHVGLADPYCPVLSRRIVSKAADAGLRVHPGGTYVCIEGPQFSTRAESRLYRSWGGAVIGMTAMPEARLAREAELCYVTLAMVTDYDVWHEAEGDVTVETVLSHLQANNETSGSILRALTAQLLPERTCACGNALRDAMMTGQGRGDAADWERLGAIVQRYLPSPERD
jgi:5'-methylthioadenosine phosphorylase